MLRRVLAYGAAIALIVRPARAQRPFERLFYYVDTENSYASLVRHVDLIGSWQGMFDLSVFLGDRIQGFMCAAKHVREPQPVRGPASRTGR